MTLDPASLDGILIIDKPEGCTSHDVCQRIKRAWGCRRVGHTGTLDPFATGVLPLLLNGATKWAARYVADDKEYRVRARFGMTTTTYDREGEVMATTPVPADLARRVAEALPRFRGTVEQIPPPFSAVKVGGRPLYWWARRGRAVSAPERCVRVDTFAVDPADSLADDEIAFRIVCGKGTYVRALIHDLGQYIGCGAHATALRRVRSGEFTLDQARPLDAALRDPDCLKSFTKNGAAC